MTNDIFRLQGGIKSAQIPAECELFQAESSTSDTKPKVMAGLINGNAVVV